jgi:pyridoxine 5-phosphate synthase
MKRLGVNIDHIATLRQQRKEGMPDLMLAAQTAVKAGADGITIHLREDRRHIQDQDVFDIRSIVPYLNLEMAATDEMVEIALKAKPNACCLVPEKREELTTEGGLDVAQLKSSLIPKIKQLKDAGIAVSLFVAPSTPDLEAAAEVGADIVELHTGHYAQLSGTQRDTELFEIIKASDTADQLGLRVHAGHGLDLSNVQDVAAIHVIEELNIGFSIVSRAIFVGLESAIQEMKALIV